MPAEKEYETRRTGRREERRAEAVASRGAQQQPFVETARAITLQIERHIPVADCLQLAHDRGRHLGLEGSRQLVASDLDARELVMMTNSADSESEAAQRLFGPLDRPQLLVGDLGEVWDT